MLEILQATCLGVALAETDGGYPTDTINNFSLSITLRYCNHSLYAIGRKRAVYKKQQAYESQTDVQQGNEHGQEKDNLQWLERRIGKCLQNRSGGTNKEGLRNNLSSNITEKKTKSTGGLQ